MSKEKCAILTPEQYERQTGRKYNTRGMKETCLNCIKKSCILAGCGNIAGYNENDGCWVG